MGLSLGHSSDDPEESGFVLGKGAIVGVALGGHVGFSPSECSMQLQMAVSICVRANFWVVIQGSLIWRAWSPGPSELNPENPNKV